MPLQNSILIVVFSLLAPAALIPLEAVLPYPVFIEELVISLIIVYCVVFSKITTKRKILWAGMIGALFGLSENMFYLSMQLSEGTAGVWWERFVITLPMHVIKAIIFVLIVRDKKTLIPLGFVIAVLVHYVFNARLA